MTGRRRRALACLLLAAGAPAFAAPTVDLEVGVHSAYIDSRSFNERVSDRPVVQATASVELGRGFYVEPYAYSGFRRPFADAGAEYGMEGGWAGNLVAGYQVNAALGRWANYAGEGLGAGDWFARVGLTRGAFEASATMLRGDTGGLLLNARHEFRLAQRVRVTPSGAYASSGRALTPGVELFHGLGGHWALAVRAVAPERGQRRTVHGSLGIVWTR